MDDTQRLANAVSLITTALSEAGYEIRDEGGGPDSMLLGLVTPEDEQGVTHALLAISRRNVANPEDLPPVPQF